MIYMLKRLMVYSMIAIGLIGFWYVVLTEAIKTF